MPVSYKYGKRKTLSFKCNSIILAFGISLWRQTAPLWTLPQFQAKANAFFEAVKHIYNIDILEPYKQKAAGLRYGVAAASGRAISRYSLDPDATRRAYLQLALLPSSEVATNTIAVYRKDDLQGSTAWTGFIGATQEGFYACGLRAKYSHKRAIDSNGGGISGLDVRYCSKDDWFDQEQKIVYRLVSIFKTLAKSRIEMSHMSIVYDAPLAGLSMGLSTNGRCVMRSNSLFKFNQLLK